MNQNKTILIVEDEVSLRKALADTLEKENFIVLEAENGKEGVKQALQNHPDLILLDLLMPIMNGIDALKHIRQDSWGAKAPVIILTVLSATDENLIKTMVAERPLFYLIKSDWKIYDVVKKIKEVLKA
jgi:DNA-binding response OmpR family regulator